MFVLRESLNLGKIKIAENIFIRRQSVPKASLHGKQGLNLNKAVKITMLLGNQTKRLLEEEISNYEW
ncbi:MAG: hypothetical protein KAW56_08780 [Candidatus Marinimicrobia bacterium]|nr:hypothetical protein [Candidatus Neomarinimicrobiota bacterium]